MLCKMEGCKHKARTTNNRSLSWKKWNICVCCAIELKYQGVLSETFTHSTKCYVSLCLEKFLNTEIKTKDPKAVTRDRSKYSSVTIYEQTPFSENSSF